MSKSVQLVALPVLQFTILVCGPASAQEKKPALRSIPELIQQLGSPRFHEREAAHKTLLTREEAYPDLRRALPTLNAEGRRRATAILDAMTKRRMKRFLQFGREGRVDLFVEWSSIAGKNVDSNEFWQCALDIAWQQLKRGHDEANFRGWLRDFPARSYPQFQRDRRHDSTESDTIETVQFPIHLALRGPADIKGRHQLGSIVVTTGSIKLDGLLQDCIVLTTGDVKIDVADHVLIISDKNVPGVQLDSIVASRQNLAHRSIVTGNLSGGLSSTSPELPRTGAREVEQYDLLYRPGEPPRRVFGLPAPPPENTPEMKVAENKRVPTDGLCFFEINDLGLECTAQAGLVEVRSVDAKGPFAKAGLKPGDFIRTIDGADTDDVESARRQFRHAFVLGGAELKISRRGKPMTLNVNFFGWELPRG